MRNNNANRKLWLCCMAVLSIVLLCLAVGPKAVQAAPPEPYLVRDINTGTYESNPQSLVEMNGVLYFASDDNSHGAELWRSDGTITGTLMVKDIYQGGELNGSWPKALTAMSDTLYFSAYDDIHGRELWKSDGTEAGTVLVKDLYPGTASADPQFLTPVDGGLFFFADDGVHGQELWWSDGTEAGTVLVKDIYPGSGASSPPGDRAVIGDILYFAAADNTHGRELWRSDGTTGGTYLVKDIYAGGQASYPRYFVVLSDTLYFSARQSGYGQELWRSDGTTDGTVQVHDIYPGTGSSSPSHMTVKDEAFLLFSAANSSNGSELWRSDGTVTGTVMVKDIYPGTGSSLPTGFTAAGDTMVFYATDAAHGKELWKSDGTVTGTVLVKDIYSGTENSYTSLGVTLIGLDGTAYFPAQDGIHGHELWKSDGTVTGTVLIKDIYPQLDGSYVHELAPYNGLLFFQATDNFHGAELWRSDGTEGGTVMVRDINTWGQGAWPDHMVALDGQVAFAAFEGTHGTELWMSDGTTAGTRLIRDMYPAEPSSSPYRFAALDEGFLFSAREDIHGRELWRSDGTVSGTVLIKDIYPGSADSSPDNFNRLGDVLLFSANDADHGTELWRSDGTTDGTFLVKDIHTGGYSSGPTYMTPVSGTLFFSAEGVADGRELWKSDGSGFGTVLVKDIYPGSTSSSPIFLANLNGTLLFAANDGSHGKELWRSDGTEASTVLVKDVYPGSGSSYPGWIYATAGGTAFFSADDGYCGYELWRSDGTTGGTTLVKDIYLGSSGSMPQPLEEVDGIFFFSADDGTHGAELWKSDGTEAGTVMVKDINPGSADSNLYEENAIAANGLLYFAAHDGTDYELWQSDGTEAGTVRISDVGPPGFSDVGVSRLTLANGVIFMLGDDQVHGPEVWALVIGPLDLAITKTVEPTGLLAPGMPITYTVAFDNVGPGLATGIAITDVVPAEIANLSYTHTGAIVTPTGGISYAWQVADLRPGEGGVITINGVISPSVGGVFSLTNRALISSTLPDVNPADNESAVISIVDAEPPLPPILLSPPDGTIISDTMPTLAWQPSPSADAAGYLLDLAGTITDLGDVTQYTCPLLAEGLYTWTVAAYDALGNTSPFTATWAFTLNNAPPVPPILLSPPDGAVISDTTPTLSWQPSPSPDVTGYLLDLAGTITDVGNVTQYTCPLLADGSYTWTVAAYDTRYTSAFPSAWALQICQPVANVQLKRDPGGELFIGNTVRFFANAEGSTPFSYTWTLNGVPTGENWYVWEHAFDAAGLYTVAVTVSNACSQENGALVVQVQEPSPGQPDLSASEKSANLSTVGSGDILTYTLILRNQSWITATATMTDPIPLHTAYVTDSAWASDGSPVTLVDGHLLWVGPVISGTPVMIQFAVEVQVAPHGATISNSAQVDDGQEHIIMLEASSIYNPGYGLSINDGALFTNIPTVTLGYLWNLDDNITHVQFSNDGGFGPGGGTTPWMPVDPADPTYPNWVLQVEGQFTFPYWVYARFRDSVGFLHGPFRDSIVYDPDPPSTPLVVIIPLPNGGAQTIQDTDIIVRVTAGDANSGIDKVQLSDTPEFTQFSELPFVGPTTDIPWTLPASGEVYVRVMDRAGNFSLVGSGQRPANFKIYLPLVVIQG